MIELQAPTRSIDYYPSKIKVFLAGSIENGAAEEWQKKMLDFLRPYDIMVFNPRRYDWDSTWTNDNPELHKQIQWELDHIKEANLIYFYFDENTKSPISLLELGLCVGLYKNIVAYCPDKFYRRKNVEVTLLQNNRSLLTNIFEQSKVFLHLKIKDLQDKNI